MTYFSELLGKTLSSVRQSGNESIEFVTSDGEKYIMHHQQDCCENVTIEDINGDLVGLVGNPILVAEEATSTDHPAGVPIPQYEDESHTWTFYKLATINGHVDIRWYGSSNGYYSESVDIYKVSP